MQKKFVEEEFAALPKMRDFDWRLDLKTASKTQERMKKPSLYLSLEMQDNTKVQFEMGRQQLKDVLQNFESINTQLAALTGGSQ